MFAVLLHCVLTLTTVCLHRSWCRQKRDTSEKTEEKEETSTQKQTPSL